MTNSESGSTKTVVKNILYPNIEYPTEALKIE